MTMPHLMNCAHMDDGWCLTCVRDEWLLNMEVRGLLAALLERQPVKESKLLESFVKYSQGILSMTKEEYAEAQKELNDSMNQIAQNVLKDTP